MENACIKVRRYDLAAAKIFFFLKNQEFKFQGAEFKLQKTTAIPSKILNLIRPYFDKIWNNRELYRATGVIMSDLTGCQTGQLDLFGQAQKDQAMIMVYKNLDSLSAKYGKHTVFLGSSLSAMGNQHDGNRGLQAKRKTNLFKGETDRKRLGIPLLGQVT